MNEPLIFNKPCVVSEDYKIQHNYRNLGFDVVMPEGRFLARQYNPETYKELPVEISKLKEYDEETTLKLLRSYGCLGAPFSPSWGVVAIPSLTGKPYYLAGTKTQGSEYDPLPWIWAHAHTLRLCLAICEALNDPLADVAFALTDVLPGFNETKKSSVHSWSLLAINQKPFTVHVSALDSLNVDKFKERSGKVASWIITTTVAIRGSIQRVRWLGIRKKHSIKDLARAILRDLINWNLAGLRYQLTTCNKKDRFLIDYTALIEVAYWHLASAIASMKVKRCLSCGVFFIQNDPRRQYCPPEHGKKESACAIRMRVRHFRETGKKQKKVKSLSNMKKEAKNGKKRG